MPPGELVAVLGEDLDDGAARRPADGARGRAQLGGGGDRRPGHLGRAVEVVDDVAELVHEPERERTGERRAAHRHHAERPGPALVRWCSGRSRIRWSITGTATRAWARCWEAAVRVAAGSKRRWRTTVEASSEPSSRLANPQAWKSGAAMQRRLAGPVGDAREDGDRRVDAAGAAPRRALGRPGGPRGEDDDPPRARRAAATVSSACALGEGVERGGRFAAGSSCQARNRLRRRRPRGASSVNSSSWIDHPGLLAPHHPGELRDRRSRC